ncbi:MAG: MFS transporter, partial [Phenylobacterium sp.]|nr:MFS transporter [Phenylobacterium sp.]
MFPVYVSATVIMAGQQSLALFPALGRQLQIPDHVTALLTALSAAVTILLNPWWGARIERFGARAMLCLGLAGMAVGSAAFAGTLMAAGVVGAGVTLYVLMGLVRALQPAAVSAFTPAAFSYIAEVATAETRAKVISRYTAFVTLGSMAAMLGAALLAHWSLAVPFLVVTIMSVACLVLVVVGVRPDRVASTPAARPAMPAKLRMRDDSVWPWVLASAASGLLLSVWQLGTTFHLIDRFGRTPQEAATTVGSLFFIVFGIGFLVRMLVVPRLKMKADVLVMGSLAGMGVATLLLGFVRSDTWLYPLFGVAGLLFGAVSPAIATRLSLSVQPSQQGLAGGLNTSAALVGVMVGSTLTGSAYPLHPEG